MKERADSDVFRTLRATSLDKIRKMLPMSPSGSFMITLDGVSLAYYSFPKLLADEDGLHITCRNVSKPSDEFDLLLPKAPRGDRYQFSIEYVEEMLRQHLRDGRNKESQ